MYYDFRISVPANTPESAPVENIYDLTLGVITRVEVQFPIGTLALLHCKILHQEHQAWPTNSDGDFASDGYTIPIDEYYPLDSAPFQIKVKAWNLDDTYAHTLTVRIGLLRPEEMEPAGGLFGGLRKFLKMVGVR